MGEYCNLCNLIHFLSQTLIHTGKNGIFLFTRALSPTSYFQRRLAHMAPRKPPPAGPARSTAGVRRHRSAEGRLRQGCSGPPPLPPLSHLLWLSARRCWQRCFPAPLTSSGSVGRQRHCSRTSLPRCGIAGRPLASCLTLARYPPVHGPRLPPVSSALPQAEAALPALSAPAAPRLATPSSAPPAPRWFEGSGAPASLPRGCGTAERPRSPAQAPSPLPAPRARARRDV